MLNWRKRDFVGYAGWILFCFSALCNVKAFALEPKPEATVAKWGGSDWGIVKVVPSMVKYGDKVHIHGMVVGGPASDPFWSCSQYEAWKPNGTSSINITIPGEWDMPFTGHDIFGNKVNIMNKDGGDPPPYGWEDRISDECYCVVTDFGANGGCQSREVQPDLFTMMDQFNSREGNVQVATVLSGSGWTQVSVQFSGGVGVAWSDIARDYIYIIADEDELTEDADNDGLPDAWEIAHSPNNSLDDFAGGNTPNRKIIVSSETDWVNPYAPSEPDWISAGPNDWDGDGFTNKDEYMKWKNNKTDSNELPYDPTVINTGAACPATIALGNGSRGKDLRILRKFRDEVLSKNPVGQEIIKLYYELGPNIVKAMAADEALKTEIKEMIEEFFPLVRNTVE